MKKIALIILFYFIVALFTGCGHKSDLEQTDIEQFRCQDSIQTVFDVLGESDFENVREKCKYEELNLWGYEGSIAFDLRDDKDTIKSFCCYLTLNKKEFEDIIAYFSEKYGSYEVDNWGENLTWYKWKINNENWGYSEISIRDNKNKEYAIFFSDEWSGKTDEAYYEHLEEENKEEVNVIFYKDYEIDGEKMNISLNEIQDDLKVIVYGEAKTEEKASLLLTIVSGDMKGINYTVSVKCGDLFILITSDGIVSGTNRDGTTCFKVPDWYDFPDEEDLTEELKDYIKNVKEAEKDFLEEISDLTNK